MDKAQLDALLVAHGGRTQAVASLHVLRPRRPQGSGGPTARPRQGSTQRHPLADGVPTLRPLSPVEQAFLRGNAAALATIDLSRWLDLAAPEQRADVIDALVALAERDPSRFEHEIARAPRFGLSAEERMELIIRLVGRAPESVIAALSPEAGLAKGSPEVPPAPRLEPAAPAPESEAFFDPGEILADLDFEPELLVPGGGGEPDPGKQGDLGDLLGGDLLGDEGLFGGADLLDSPPPGGGSRSPALDALLADLASAKTPRARAAWKKRSLEVAGDLSEDWGPRVTVLTAPLRAAVIARAGLSPRGDERAALLEWLLLSGAPRSLVVGLTLGLVALGDAAKGAAAGGGRSPDAVRGWLAQSFLPRLLPDKAAWGRHGAAVLDSLASHRLYSELDELFAQAASGGASLGPGLLTMTGAGAADLQIPLFSAMSAMLIARVKGALAGGDRKEALAAAAALCALGIPAKARSAVLALGRKKAARGEIATLLSFAASRARAAKDPPRLEDLIASVHVLSDAAT